MNPTSSPFNNPSSVARISNLFSTSATMTNRNGDNISPYHKPLSILNGLYGAPLNSNEMVADVIHMLIHDRRLCPKPISLRTAPKLSHSMESYAFWKISLSRIPDLLDFFNHTALHYVTIKKRTVSNETETKIHSFQKPPLQMKLTLTSTFRLC